MKKLFYSTAICLMVGLLAATGEDDPQQNNAPPQTPESQADAARSSAAPEQPLAYAAFDDANEEVIALTASIDDATLQWAYWYLDYQYEVDQQYWDDANDAYAEANDLSNELHDWYPGPDPNYFPGSGDGLVRDLYWGDEAMADGEDFYTGTHYIKAKDEFNFAESSWLIVKMGSGQVKDAASLEAWNFYINVMIPAEDEFWGW